MKSIILHPYTPVREDQQIETKYWLQRWKEDHPDWAIYHINIPAYWDTETHPAARLAYATYLQAWWKYPAPLIIVEQDIVPTDSQIQELDSCSYPFCTIPYHLRERQWSVWEWNDAGMMMFVKAAPFKEFLPGSSLGCVKFDVERITEFDVPTSDWSNLDNAISHAMTNAGFQWHVHQSEVKHNRTAGDMR